MAAIVIAAVGTHGGVRPGLALARRMLPRNEVTLLAPPENEPATRAAGVCFVPLGMRSADVVAHGILEEYRGQMRLQFREHRELYRRADLLVGMSLLQAGRQDHARGKRSARGAYQRGARGRGRCGHPRDLRGAWGGRVSPESGSIAGIPFHIPRA